MSQKPRRVQDSRQTKQEAIFFGTVRNTEYMGGFHRSELGWEAVFGAIM